eukprot:619688-Prorocentrum_minimum.AAC.1
MMTILKVLCLAGAEAAAQYKELTRQTLAAAGEAAIKVSTVRVPLVTAPPVVGSKAATKGTEIVRVSGRGGETPTGFPEPCVLPNRPKRGVPEGARATGSFSYASANASCGS